MGKLLNLISKFKALDLEQVASSAMTEVKEDVVIAQRSQLTQGISSTGGTLKKYRSPSYAKYKNALNPLPGLGNPDLKLTGAFQGAISATVQGGKLIIKSSDEKAMWLEANYGKDKIFGLYPEEKKLLIKEKLRPAFMRNIRKNVGL